jgi:hypothetical protein
LAEDGASLRKRVIIGLAVAYWVAAGAVAYFAAVLEQRHILTAMHPAFLAGDPHTRHMANAAAEQADEAELVTLICAGALFVLIILIWRVNILMRAEKADATAMRRAARRALFDEPAPGE